MKIKVFYVENIYGETEICFHKLETAISEVRRLLIDTIETSQIEYLVEQYLASGNLLVKIILDLNPETKNLK